MLSRRLLSVLSGTLTVLIMSFIVKQQRFDSSGIGYSTEGLLNHSRSREFNRRGEPFRYPHYEIVGRKDSAAPSRGVTSYHKRFDSSQSPNWRMKL